MVAPAAHLAGAEVGMPELLTIRRAPLHGTDGSRPLATGFSAPAPIRPASPVATGTPVGSPSMAGPAGPVSLGEHRLWRRPSAATPVASSRPARGAAGAAPRNTGPNTLRRLVASAVAGAVPAPASAPAPGARRAAAATTAAGPVTGWSSSAAPTAALPAALPAAPARAAASAPAGQPGRAVRRLTVAPPRISVAPPTPPPVPAVAADLAGPGTTPSGGSAPAGTGGPETLRRSTGGGSLVDATAHLFRTEESVVRRALGGDSPMLPDAPPPPPPLPAGSVPAIYGSSLVSDPGRQDLPEFAGHPDAPPPGVAFDALVDAVVERIERRVVEELERRGRSHGRGGF